MQTDIERNISKDYNFWGFSELSITSVQCKRCVSEDIISLGTNVGMALAGCTLILIFLVILMKIIVVKRDLNKKEKKKKEFRKLKKKKDDVKV